jgi:hypothetical protein
MSIDISRKTEARLRATAQAEGISVDDHVERLMNEREELAAIVARTDARMPALSHEEIHAKIERGFLQSERGEVVDGEAFASGLIAELDEREHNQGSR